LPEDGSSRAEQESDTAFPKMVFLRFGGQFCNTAALLSLLQHQMEVDEYLLELNFILLNGETAYKDATTAFTITLSSTANIWKLRVAVQQECTRSNLPFQDIRLDKLDVYKASLSPSESNALIQEIKNGRRIANSEWKTSLLGDLGLLSHYFTKQPDKTAIHLIVDCKNAGEFRATLRSR
jgi:Crinkler effector protein N-terminal domain